MEKLESGAVSAQDLDGMGLSPARLKAFIQEIERARALLAAVRGNPDAPPTFADLLKAMDASQKSGKDAVNGGAAGGSRSDKGRGELRDIVEGMKETVDLEYQQLLEEYYRSLADPAWKRPRK